MEARLTIPIRWRDLDMLGHLNQAVYHELLEEARAALVEMIAPGDFAFVLARTELDYRAEVTRHHGAVDVTARPAAVGRSSFTITHAVLLPDGTVAAEGRAVLVAWDPSGRHSRRLSDAEREKLTAAVEAVA